MSSGKINPKIKVVSKNKKSSDYEDDDNNSTDSEEIKIKAKSIKSNKSDKAKSKSDIDNLNQLSSILSISPFADTPKSKKPKEGNIIKNVKIDLENDSKDDIIKKLVQKVEYLDQELIELRRYADDTYYTFRDHYRDIDNDKKNNQ